MMNKQMIISVLARLRLLVPAGYMRLLLHGGQWAELARDALHPRPLDIDGAPVPPAYLRILVSGSLDRATYLDLGRAAADSIRETLIRNGLSPEQFRTVLDFGCGVGRVIRHWPAMSSAKLHGTDYNPRMIDWNREHLRFARFDLNQAVPPLRYGDGSFDFIYALSVLTHLPETLQHAWMRELWRVLEPGGCLLITTHGDHHLDQLEPLQQQRFRAGEMVVKNESVAGSNFCNAFHPQSWVRSHLVDGFTVVDFIAAGASGNPGQDIYLLKKSGLMTSKF